MAVVVTGGEGFIGVNLMVRLREKGVDALSLGSGASPAELEQALSRADAVFHLAGVNRSQDPSAFERGNHDFTQILVSALDKASNPAPIIFASTSHATLDTPYGVSKRRAEDVLLKYSAATGRPLRIFRLPNVFGKWARPNYNSVVATFCHNIARGLEIRIDDPAAPLSLVHIDSLCDAFLGLLDGELEGSVFCDVEPVYKLSVGELAELIRGFAASRTNLTLEGVGQGLPRALYATYVSYLPPEAFDYDLPRHEDSRGVFVEMLKTPSCGQFSYFTAKPGVTRGSHYHHAKTEKFLVLSGEARFGFRHLVSNQRHEIIARGGEGRVVETIPGWTHDVTNIGEGELVVMLWANEVFDRQRPDTVAQAV